MIDDLIGTSKLSDSLDYNLTSVEERLEAVNRIIEDNDDYLIDCYDNHYNANLKQEGFLSENSKMGKDLEALATYLLHGKDDKGKEEDVAIVTDYKKKRNSTREASIEDLVKISDFKRSETNKSIFKLPKIKVNAEDRKKYEELKISGEVIDNLTKMIDNRVDSKGDTLSEKEIRRLKWIRTDIQKDEIAIKTELKKYVSFQSAIVSDGFNDNLSYIRFDDAEIMRLLLHHYSELKNQSWDDTYGYMKIILIDFERIVEKSNLEDYLYDILIWKIDKLQQDEIIEKLKEKYGITMRKQALSKITREVLPNTFVKTYKQEKEDWLYTHIMKGNYKCCSKCKENLLENSKNFHYDKTYKSGFHPTCKKCKKEKRKKSVLLKNESQ